MSTWTAAVCRNDVLRAERTLAEIRTRLAVPVTAGAEFARYSGVDVHRLVGAVDGVLALHRPADRGDCRICARRRRFPGWPCATVRTVARSLIAPPPNRPTGPAGRPAGEEGSR
ncbi:MAG TPA: hypothetical protein VFX70_05815 [Mycobacteriales bacterium]|nr:hypothetical protein [Mycobacteriales bacterium]